MRAITRKLISSVLLACPCRRAAHPRSRAMLNLNPEWTALMRNYEADHSDPRNRVCHQVGIPLIAASVPVGATIVGLPAAAGLFTLGWTFQFVGHLYEGKKPSFVGDRRYLV